MARLIDANELVRKANKLEVFYFTGETDIAVHDCQMVELGAVLAEIDEAPTVDAVEVKHGHWCWEGRFKACSQCGSYVEWDETLGANFWKFCPYCGAKMDLEE